MKEYEKYTYRNKAGFVYLRNTDFEDISKGLGPDEFNILCAAFDRLAEYEETGLLPEEVKRTAGWANPRKCLRPLWRYQFKHLWCRGKSKGWSCCDHLLPAPLGQINYTSCKRTCQKRRKS